MTQRATKKKAAGDNSTATEPKSRSKAKAAEAVEPEAAPAEPAIDAGVTGSGPSPKMRRGRSGPRNRR